LEPSVFSGLIIVPGILDYQGTLTARVGEYESYGVPVLNGAYSNLIVDALSGDLIGARINFYLDGFEARTSHILGNGERREDLDLIFVQIPKPAEVVSPKKPIVVATVKPTENESSAVVKKEVKAPLKEVTVKESPTPVVVVKEVVVVVTPTAVPAPAADEKDDDKVDVETVGSGCGKPEGGHGGIGGAMNVLAFVGPVMALAILRNRSSRKNRG
tara:strand:+ start:128 stop:772 length:645 start_codon:yes stop_codon:yes gene_type:complete